MTEQNSSELEALLAQLRKRVEARRESGEYPAELEEKLDQHFQRIATHQIHGSPHDLTAAVRDWDKVREFGTKAVPGRSRIPGGYLAYRMTRLATRRDRIALVEQLQDFSDELAHVLDTVVDEFGDATSHVHNDLLNHIDQLYERLADLLRGANHTDDQFRQLSDRVDAVEKRLAEHDQNG